MRGALKSRQPNTTKSQITDWYKSRYPIECRVRIRNNIKNKYIQTDKGLQTITNKTIKKIFVRTKCETESTQCQIYDAHIRKQIHVHNSTISRYRSILIFTPIRQINWNSIASSEIYSVRDQASVGSYEPKNNFNLNIDFQLNKSLC